MIFSFFSMQMTGNTKVQKYKFKGKFIGDDFYSWLHLK